MNTRKKAELALLVALLAVATVSPWLEKHSEVSPAASEFAAPGKLVQTVVRHADDSRLSAILVQAPIVVWLLLLLD